MLTALLVLSAPAVHTAPPWTTRSIFEFPHQPLHEDWMFAAAADLNGDAKLDFAIGSNDWTRTELSVHLQDRRDRFRWGPPAIEINDAIAALSRLFLGGALLPCLDAADADDDGALSLADPVLILSWLFLGGPPPAEPGPDACGEDPTADALPPCSTDC